MKTKRLTHIKIGDRVKVITGESKGLLGTIKTILVKKSVVYIEGITPRLRAVKTAQDKTEQVKELQIPIHFSNVMLWDNQGNTASRIGYKIVENKKRRYFKKSGNLLEK